MAQINPPLPAVDPSKDVWGSKLVQALTAIVSELNAQDTAIAALKLLIPSAGLTSVSEATPGLKEAVQDITASSLYSSAGLTWAYDDANGRITLILDPSSNGSTAGTGTTGGTSGGTGSTGSSGTGGSSGSSGTTTPVVTTKKFTESTAIFPNPERGFFQYSETHYKSDSSGYSPLVASNLQDARNQNRTVVFRYFVMEKYVGNGSTLDQTFLNLIAADLQACRDAGMKLLPRFCYSTSGNQEQPVGDAPNVATILAHQTAIAAVLNQYKDVVHAVQCGMIGMWGEWYYTDLYGQKGTVNDSQWADRLAVLNKWLELLDPSISVLVRYVGIKIKRFGQNSTDALANRVGFHNDGFLAPYGDYGTFSTFTSIDETTARQYLSDQTLIAPMNGESASYNGDNSNGTAAKAALAQFHWDLLNPEYNKSVLGQWSNDETAEITRRLGYRLSLTSADLPTVTGGTSATVSFTLTNTGYAPLRHDKTMYITVETGPNTFVRYPVSGSPAAIRPGYSATFSTTITAPAANGDYNLHLELVDPNLPTRSEYAVRLANSETTFTSTRNRFGTLTVGATSTGSTGTSGSTGTAASLATEAGAALNTELGDLLTV